MAKPVIPNKRTAFESVRTLIGNENQVIRELGLPYTVKPNTTLNQLLGINQSMHPPHTTIPTIGYFCIGYGGISLQNCTNDSDAFPMPKIFQHTAEDTGLFKPVPFVMREFNNDLTAQERTKYALRVVETYKGVKYYSYYLKRLDLSKTRVETKIITVADDGSLSEEDYSPTITNLNPIAQELSAERENILKAKYGRSIAQVNVNISREDVEELKNVFNIRHGDPNRALITEIGLVSGVDKLVEVTTSSGRSQFQEVIAAQIAHINATIQYLAAVNDGFDSIFNLGVNEPLYNLQQGEVSLQNLGH